MAINACNPFKGRQYPGEVIVLCVRWYLRYPLSYEQAKFRQRYVMSHRNVVDCGWAKALGQFCSSHGDHPVSRSVLGA
jgi:hypothetical protein